MDFDRPPDMWTLVLLGALVFVPMCCCCGFTAALYPLAQRQGMMNMRR